jgi:hypothetical protein
MKALFVRDLLTQRWVIVLAGVYSLFFFGLFGLTDEGAGSMVYVLAAIASGLIVTFGSFKADRGDTLTFMLSLPQTKRDAVNERFLLLVISTVFGLVCAGVFGAMLSPTRLVASWITPLDLIRIASGVGILSVAIPIYLRFGHKAVRVMMVVVLALGVLLQLVFALVLALSPSSLTDIIDAVIAWYTATPLLERNLYWLAAGVVLGSGSYAVSLWFYPRRDVEGDR